MYTPKRFIALAFLLFPFLSLFAQAPTNNPYTDRFNPEIHWTSSLRWTNVTEASSVSGLVGANRLVDSTALQDLMNSISTQGGGVIYFAADSFKFNYDLVIPTGVVLRGATPSTANATDENYRPGTVFAFPKYHPTFTGNGTSRNTAFKEIKGKVNAHDLGLVNLDINRAGIAIHPYAYADAPGVNTKWPVDINYNILIFGVRSNNVATPDPSVPNTTAGTATEPAQEGWQRYVWRFSSNVGLYVSQNGVVANCRINDTPTDSYNQPGYVLRNFNNPNCMSGGVSKLNEDGSDAKFEVTDHLGIDLNRAKINKENGGAGTGPNSPYGIYGFVMYATPTTEPQLFAPGNEVRDCRVFKTRRVGIIAAGNGLVVDNNTVRDQANKIAFIRANGQGCETNNSATHENRGIDVSGWNVRLTRNDIEVRRHTIGGPGGYGSVDGEGVLVQECCGGTSVRDYTFKHNKLTEASSGYIGLWKMRTMYNVYIDSNDLGCKNIYLTANTNGAPFQLFNSTINNNTNVDRIIASADLGGANLIIERNSFCGNGIINAPGFATVNDNGNATVTPGPGEVVVAPSAIITSPADGARFFVQDIVNITATATLSDSIQYFVNSSPLGPFAPATVNSAQWTAPTERGFYFISARVKNSEGVVTWSVPVRVIVGTVSNVYEISSGYSVFVYPNPSEGVFNLYLPENQVGDATFRLTDISGKQMKAGILELNNPKIDMSTYPQGIYQLVIQAHGKRSVVRLVKN